MQKIHFYFIRHGQTYLNKYMRMQGWADSPLTPEGEVVASQTGIRLKDYRFDGVYTSDLGRTIQTAKLILAENTGKEIPEIIQKMELRESFFGSLEGGTRAETYEMYAKTAGLSIKEVFESLTMEEFMDNVKLTDPTHEAENYKELWTRINKGIQDMVNDNIGEVDRHILVVTHGNIIRNIFKKYMPDLYTSLEILNASLSELVYEDGVYKVESFNTIE